jgi:hypothetical protein
VVTAVDLTWAWQARPISLPNQADAGWSLPLARTTPPPPSRFWTPSATHPSYSFQGTKAHLSNHLKLLVYAKAAPAVVRPSRQTPCQLGYLQ